MVITHEIFLDCKGYCDMHDITEQVAAAVANSGLRSGIVVVFTPSTTSSILRVRLPQPNTSRA